MRGVSFDLRPAEIHALVGENGAGKSTLVKLLTGVLRVQEGCIELDGVPLRLTGPQQAQRLGVAVVHQSYHLFPELTVAENILGVGARVDLLVRRRRTRDRAREVLRRCGTVIDPGRLAGELDAAERKFVEIARALASDVRFLILDEPTAALDRRQTELLISLLRRLRAAGAGLLLVTHRLDEVLQAADRCTVLRNGEQVGVLTRDQDMTADEVVLRILGRKHVPGEYGRGPRGPELLRVSGLRLRPGAPPMDVDVRGGQVVGVIGLVGSGAATLLRRLSGVVSDPAARILVDGVGRRIRSVRDALAAGIAYIPEDRRTGGIFADMSVATNLSIAALDQVSRWGLVRRRARVALAERYRSVLDVRCRSLAQPLGTLSGGNQQKVMIGRWLASGARILVMEEPTQGVDIGARREIHRLLRAHAQSGGAVLFLSSDLDELADLADRIVVIRHGEVVDIVDNGGQERVSSDYLIAKAAGLGTAGAGEVA